jgi:hypothetical protein
MADERAGELDDALRQPAGVHELAGEDEERHGHQHEVVGTADGVLRDDLGVELIELQHDADAGHEQCEGDRHADGDGGDENAEKDQRAHWTTLPPPPTHGRG